MEENKAVLENNVDSIEDKPRKERAMAEVETSERDRANTAMMEDLRDLREEQRRGQRQTEAGLLSIETRLLKAITNTREVSPGTVAQSTGTFPRHSQSKRSREAEPSRVSAQTSRRSEGKSEARVSLPPGKPSSSSTRISMGTEALKTENAKPRRQVTINTTGAPEITVSPTGSGDCGHAVFSAINEARQQRADEARSTNTSEENKKPPIGIFGID